MHDIGLPTRCDAGTEAKCLAYLGKKNHHLGPYPGRHTLIIALCCQATETHTRVGEDCKYLYLLRHDCAS